MNPRMTEGHRTSLETRPSLLKRLKSGEDAKSWEEFYRLYGGVIRSFAEKAGLNADEAEEVVQETAIGVARRLPGFVYDPKVCRFKTWLLNLTRWRIQDQLRKRSRAQKLAGPSRPVSARPPASEDTGSTATIERVPDPTVPEFGAEWDAAWEMNLLARALDRVRSQVEERRFQIFDLCVTKGWRPADVARTLGISSARVHLAKHRVLVQVKKEIRRLEKAAERALSPPASG